MQSCANDRLSSCYLSAEYQDRFIDCDYNVLSDYGREALARGVSEGRDGKGIIYLFAAGTTCDDAFAFLENIF